MIFYSWNVNGLRACVNKGFEEFFLSTDADMFSLQEIKMQEGQLELEFPGYESYWHYADKKGYSGTAVYTKHTPMAVMRGIGQEEFHGEGRVLTLEYPDFYYVTVYTPNSQDELARLDFRMAWEDAFRAFLNDLKSRKSVIVCGDLNVAHTEIDLKNPKTNRRNAGFTDEERGKFTELLASGFIDTFRHFYPDRTEAYTWWSYMRKARERNAGWRIDYYLASEDLKDKLRAADIHADIHGSDHCPVSLEVEF